MSTNPEREQAEALGERLYAALEHEKPCSCVDCAHGLNTADELVALVSRLEERLKEITAERDALLKAAGPTVMKRMCS